MRIAIVGAGVSGLVAAHLLHREHDVSIFEAADWIGGHTHTVRVDGADGAYDVDTGFIVMNDRNYPNFQRLLGKLGVPTQPTNMSFSVSDGHDFEYSSTSLGGLFANPRHLASPRFIRMLAEVRRFQREARELLASESDGPSLCDYLEERAYSREFVERLIVPQAAAVWSADPRQMWTFPARFLAQFFENHGMLGLGDRPRWRTIVGGSHRYVERLTAPFSERIRLRQPVTAITRVGDHVEVTAGRDEPRRFDRVIIATHSDQALAMLANPSEREREILGAIPYQRNEVVLHTDRRLLPRRRRRCFGPGGRARRWRRFVCHLSHEPPAEPERPRGAVCHPQPQPPDRSRARARQLELLTSGLHLRGDGRPAPAGRDRRRRPRSLLRRLLGLGFP